MAGVLLSEFADKMSEVMQVITKEFARRHLSELYKDKVTLPQFFILHFLHREGESKMTALAKVMKVTTAAMTGLVDRLVRYGYAVRGYDPADRRVIKIKLTDKGKELAKRINQQRRQMVLKIFGQISESDRQNYLRIVTQIKDILAQDNELKK